MLPRILSEEDSTASVSAVPAAGSLEAFRLGHVGTAVHPRERAEPSAAQLAGQWPW